MKDFVRSGYEYTRSHYVAGRLGWLLCGGCGCTIPRLLALAIRLTDAGVGEYWEDVDAWIRNQESEQQILDAGLAREVSGNGPEHVVEPPRETDDRVIERCLGAFPIYGPYPTVTSGDVHIGGCCMANNSQGLYYVWEAIVRFSDGVAQVNLLLNRASPWLDVDSYLPYQGKVVIRNKAAGGLHLRIPMWANKEEVVCRVGEVEVQPIWLGNYLVIDSLKKGDVITCEFPVEETTEQFKIRDQRFTCQFRGNTLVDISPRPETKGYPLYTRREKYRSVEAPMKTVRRYVSPTIINW